MRAALAVLDGRQRFEWCGFAGLGVLTFTA
ncbi:hypothetical protein BLA50215_06809 [Burkholderia lata]|nr:hypothetical protein BLA50215_06809 [Burkholderia lata]